MRPPLFDGETNCEMWGLGIGGETRAGGFLATLLSSGGGTNVPSYSGTGPPKISWAIEDIPSGSYKFAGATWGRDLI